MEITTNSLQEKVAKEIKKSAKIRQLLPLSNR
jgi:hypothetical protein